jgi:hypothetical protein
MSLSISASGLPRKPATKSSRLDICILSCFLNRIRRGGRQDLAKSFNGQEYSSERPHFQLHGIASIQST